MRLVDTAALAAAMLCLAVTPAPAHERQTAHTLALSPGEKPGPATIAEMAWLAGHWTGEGLGGVVEEMWTPPEGGVMLGMFRLVRDGRPVFYELLTLAEEGGSLVLRLKHFNPDMTGWEEKDQAIEFPFVTRTEGVVHFAGMAFHHAGDTLTLYLAIRGEDGSVREASFRYARVKAGAATPEK